MISLEAMKAGSKFYFLKYQLLVNLTCNPGMLVYF